MGNDNRLSVLRYRMHPRVTNDIIRTEKHGGARFGLLNRLHVLAPSQTSNPHSHSLDRRYSLPATLRSGTGPVTPVLHGEYQAGLDPHRTVESFSPDQLGVVCIPPQPSTSPRNASMEAWYTSLRADGPKKPDHRFSPSPRRVQPSALAFE